MGKNARHVTIGVFILGIATIYIFYITTQGVDERLTACLNEISETYSIDDTKQLLFERTHLNGDDTEDAIVTLNTDEHCGSTGCIKEVCMSNEAADTFEPATVGFAAETVSVSGARTEGVADLVLTSRNNSLNLVWQGGRYVMQ